MKAIKIISKAIDDIFDYYYEKWFPTPKERLTFKGEETFDTLVEETPIPCELYYKCLRGREAYKRR